MLFLIGGRLGLSSSVKYKGKLAMPVKNQGKQFKKEDQINWIKSKLPAMTEADIERVYNTMADMIIYAVSTGNQVGIPGVGEFRQVSVSARTVDTSGIVPNGRSVNVPAHDQVRFAAAQEFKDAVFPTNDGRRRLLDEAEQAMSLLESDEEGSEEELGEVTA